MAHPAPEKTTTGGAKIHRPQAGQEPERPIAPHEYPRRVLLCLTGLSPAVVTETLYALLRRTPAFVPTEIVLLTTSKGKKLAEEGLVGGAQDRIRAVFAQSVHANAGMYPASVQIRVLPGSDQAPLEDIRNAADSVAVGDFIVGCVRELASDPRCAIHASLAGGRKTMGYYLGTAMALYGRAQDSLSHVLISAPFDTLPEFYFPQPGLKLALPGGGTVDTGSAQVDLVDLPFVRMGADPNGTSRRTPPSFSETVARRARMLEPRRLEFAPEDGMVRIGRSRLELHLPPLQLALYWLIARLWKRGDPIQRKNLPLDEFQRCLNGCSARHAPCGTGVQDPQDLINQFDRTLARLNAALGRILDEDSPYHVRRLENRSGRYGLGLASHEIIEPEEAAQPF
ncbi:CRISPR-associated protein, Csx6 family [Fontimonas thermophila]|uniref:CRISPR-associated protein, Csx6 family n=1 Tax=Fontimonas thermophila TaxID=1076937 RepID=A0A1I2J0S7_9GAMM|nr:CRISPR-associated ring nuclease Csm6 [Fontimonas thermophila]SFF47473.1 CRISPR-associated protein, Csx6 family [Fontimonas thermophila]